MNVEDKDIEVVNNVSDADLLKIRTNDAVVACDYLPLNENAVEIMLWDEALSKGYEEPKFENSHVLVPDDDSGPFKIDENSFHQVPLVIHGSYVQRP